MAYPHAPDPESSLHPEDPVEEQEGVSYPQHSVPDDPFVSSTLFCHGIFGPSGIAYNRGNVTQNIVINIYNSPTASPEWGVARCHAEANDVRPIHVHVG